MIAAMPALLVVDDDPTILRALDRLLKGDGHDVFFATSAREARAVLEERHIDVVLSDNHMPGETGLELLEALRAEHPGVRRVLMTARADATTRARADATGVHAIVEKPWQADELRALLRRLTM
jgi:CheY-like chemotaxis protein